MSNFIMSDSSNTSIPHPPPEDTQATGDPFIAHLRSVASQWYDQILQEEETDEYYNNNAADNKTSSSTAPYLLHELRRMMNPTIFSSDGYAEPSPVFATTSPAATDLRSGMILTLKYWYDTALLRQNYHQRMIDQDIGHCTQQVREWTRTVLPPRAPKSSEGEDEATGASPLYQQAKKQASPSATGTTTRTTTTAVSPTDVKRFSVSDDEENPATTAAPSLKTTHHLLAALYHGKKCLGGCTLGYCVRAKLLWSHVASCPRVHDCPTPWCVTSRRALQHYHSCTSYSCPHCGPVKQAMPLLKRKLGHGPRFQQKHMKKPPPSFAKASSKSPPSSSSVDV